MVSVNRPTPASKTSSGSKAPGAFPHTRWSLVLAATGQDAPETAAALEALCRAYWYPLYVHVRRCGQSAHDAQDLTQAFFCRLLEKRWLESADRERGRLRTFLLTMLKNFMCNEWRRATAQQRGGGLAQVPFDTEFAESRYTSEPGPELAAAAAFDRQWALTLLDLTMNRLRSEFAATGRSGDFETLKSCLTAQRGSLDYAGLGAQLGMNEGAARVAVHRLRKRFREIYREEISQTLADKADLDGELRHLAAALAQGTTGS